MRQHRRAWDKITPGDSTRSGYCRAVWDPEYEESRVFICTTATPCCLIQAISAALSPRISTQTSAIDIHATPTGVPPSKQLHDSFVVYCCSHYDTQVEQLMVVEPHVKFAGMHLLRDAQGIQCCSSLHDTYQSCLPATALCTAWHTHCLLPDAHTYLGSKYVLQVCAARHAAARSMLRLLAWQSNARQEDRLTRYNKPMTKSSHKAVCTALTS